MPAAFVAVGLAFALQSPQQIRHPLPDSAGPSRLPPSALAVATHADKPPVIDGVDDDAVWQKAKIISDFRQWQPTEDAAARFRTEAKVAYDSANLYVFVRAYDPHPDSIIRILERRDTWTPSDMIWLFIDSFHDRRTGYEFGVNAAGVKLDQAIYDDGNEDIAWDAVWDVATRIDSLGWTAEYKIPLSQLRYTVSKDHTFGLMIDRDIYRFSERDSWPVLRQSVAGMVSQFSDLGGLVNLQAPRTMEAMPYVVVKNAATIVNNTYQSASAVSAGGDIQYRLSPNLTLQATVNPDFAQVEADPAVLNLTAYETFFDERRPFFVAGRGLFRFDVNCNNVNCSNEGIYYSRRIGRTPELASTYGDTVPEAPTPIVGAAKLWGRFPGGLVLGVLEAVTQRDVGARDTTYEPATNYAVIRVRQEMREGNSSVGAIFTAVNRSLDSWSSPYLARDAYVGAIDFRHRFLNKMYEISGSFDQSTVQGTPAAMLALETDAVHYYQRPDAGLPLDSNRTVLSGDAEEFKFDKVGGEHLMFESAYQRRSAGFEINDLGYLRRADQQSWSTWAGWFDRRQTPLYNRLQLNMNWWQYWTTTGLPLEAAYNTNLHITFHNNSSFHVGGTVGQLGTTYDDRDARGGPAFRQDPYFAPWAGIVGDDRRSVVPSLWANFWRGNDWRSGSTNLSPEIDVKTGGRFSSAFSFNWTHNISDNQWYDNYTDSTGINHYTFAHLDQYTTSATVRLNYTFTPTVSLQVYVQPFISKGTYTNLRQLSATPRAADYDARYAVYGDTSVTNDPGGFNFKELQSNVVFRWEYVPGSVLFVVWNEGRQGSTPTEGTANFDGDVRDLMRLHPANTVLVKMSYWLNW
jgi:Domain of unknown function (DUF5916)/Carbohydrate family 9 binding domain-like